MQRELGKMNRLCTYDKCEGYDMEYVWFHNPVYKGEKWQVGVLWIFSGEVIFYRTWDDWVTKPHEGVRDKVFLEITRVKRWINNAYVNYTWSIKYTNGYEKMCQVGEWEAYQIQKAWRRCISNPKYKMCRDRLDKEFRNI